MERLRAGRREDKPPAVVLGGVGGALSVTRSLSRHGVRVYALADRLSLVRASRHCAQFVDLGSDEDIQDRWLEWLETGPRGAVVLPVGDDGLELVARHRPALESMGYIPIDGDGDLMLGLLDKQRTHEVALAAGIPAPATMPASDADADAVAARIGFPCALKPVHSHLFSRHFRVKLFVADDPAQFVEILSRTDALGIEMVATEIVRGSDDRHHQLYAYIDRRGKPLCALTLRKVRQYPIHFGLGTYFVTDRNPEVMEVGLRFCGEIGLRGLANVEFKRDSRDGNLKLIECNYRFTALNELVRVAGLDLAVMTYDYLTGRQVPPVPEYRAGARFWRPIEDARAVRDYRRAGELDYGRLLTSLLYRKKHYFFDWGDPGPTFFSFWKKVKNRSRALFGKVASRA